MREARTDIWSFPPPTPIVITTNGIVKNNGEAVMGRGCALEAAQRYPDLPRRLGQRLTQTGNHTYLFPMGERTIYTLPTKHHWKDSSSIELILDSIEELVALLENTIFKDIVMPRPGVGNGGLDWQLDVKPHLLHYLDDRFIICHK